MRMKKDEDEHEEEWKTNFHFNFLDKVTCKHLWNFFSIFFHAANKSTWIIIPVLDEFSCDFKD